MSDFNFQELFPLSADNTPYRKLSADGVSAIDIAGAPALQIDPGALTTLARTAFHDISHFLRPGHLKQVASILDDPEAFEAGLRQLDIISDEDSPREREAFLQEAEHGARLLGRPFHEGEFDFGDESYMASIYELGEAQRKNSELREMRTARGSADSIYLNRAYFGLYSLMGLLKAQIRTR